MANSKAMAKAKAAARPTTRDGGLSRERIVEAAIELLDAEGEEGLTFRALAARLATGAGAIYWHVANKDELAAAAAEVVVAAMLAALPGTTSPKKAIRALALGLHETVDAHPWVGSTLARTPSPAALLLIFERIGRQLAAMRIPEGLQFTAATVLGSYILAESRQNAANGRLAIPHPDRASYLAEEAARWQALDATEFAFTRSVAERLREHDDHEEFLAGVDLILAGVAASR